LRCFIANFVVTATTLMQVVLLVLAGSSLARAWLEVIGDRLSLRTGFRLWKHIGQAQVHVRSFLMRRGPPPDCHDAEPLAQMVAHLREQVAGEHCEQFAAFQEAFQVGLLR
jgi:hypothetical protein